MTTEVSTRIADLEKINYKIKRIAYEIAEDNYDEQEIILAGIGRATEGYRLAELLFGELTKIANAKIILTSIELNKPNPDESPVEFALSETETDGRVVIIVDDVANTGRTLLYAIKPLLQFSPKKIRIAVLVERKHKLFPVSPDYVGLSLSTTIQEHIKVSLRGNDAGIYLS